ncbi:MAG: hypothetical protein ACK5KT_14015 [Dysgonomonas sp.]
MSELLNNAVVEVIVGGSINITKTEELRRVIAFIIEDNVIKVPIGENMTIDIIKTRNVSELWIKPDNSSSEWTEIDINTPIAVNISGDYDLLVKVERQLTDSQSSIYMKTTTIQ